MERQQWRRGILRIVGGKRRGKGETGCGAGCGGERGYARLHLEGWATMAGAGGMRGEMSSVETLSVAEMMSMDEMKWEVSAVETVSGETGEGGRARQR